MLGPGHLVFCAGTALRASIAERIRAAAAAGFSAISLWAEDYQRARAEGFSDADLRALLDEHGLTVGELDGVSRWLPGTLENMPFGHTADEFWALADALGARSLNVMEIFGARVPVDVAAESFARVCDAARGHGLLVHLEFLPWSGIPDLASAWEIVRLAGRDNGGLMLDSWHHIRSGQGEASLRRVPGERIFGVQLSDAPEKPDGHIMDETTRKRRLPGEGDGELARLVRVLDEIGSTAPLGVEVFSEELSKLPTDEIARRAAQTTRAVVAQARSHS